jgi:hypothetical protein
VGDMKCGYIVDELAKMDLDKRGGLTHPTPSIRIANKGRVPLRIVCNHFFRIVISTISLYPYAKATRMPYNRRCATRGRLYLYRI